MSPLLSRLHPDIKLSGIGDEARCALEDVRALVAFSPVRLAPLHLSMMCGRGSNGFCVESESTGSAPWLFQLQDVITTLAKNREINLQQCIPESLIVGECDWDTQGGGLLVLLAGATAPGLYRLPMNARDQHQALFIASSVEELLVEARHLDRLFPRFAQARVEEPLLGQLHPALRLVPGPSAEALLLAQQLEAKAQERRAERAHIIERELAKRKPKFRHYLFRPEEERRLFRFGAFSAEHQRLVGVGPGIELEVSPKHVSRLVEVGQGDSHSETGGNGGEQSWLLRVYGQERSLEAGRNGPPGLRQPEVLVLGDNGRGDLIVLAPQARPAGIYRVPQAAGGDCRRRRGG